MRRITPFLLLVAVLFASLSACKAGRGDPCKEDNDCKGSLQCCKDTVAVAARGMCLPMDECSSMPPPVMDSGALDTGALPDSGALDTGAPDTGAPDTGTPDTGTPDMDSGPIDASFPGDTGPQDAASADTGFTSDAA